MISEELYRAYRQRAKELNQRIMDTCLEREILTGAGKQLGILKDDVFVFDSEAEAGVLMDFVLHDYLVAGRNRIQVYRDEVGWKDEREEEMLDALLSAYTSLFRVVSVSRAQNELRLADLLHDEQEVRLTDIGFSRTAGPDLLLFTRVIPFSEFAMTSGMAFAFPEDKADYLLAQYRRLRRKFKAESEPTARFLAFFKLNTTEGMEVQYA